MAQLTQTTIWQKLTTTHPSITDIEQRRQSRLLAVMLIAMLGINVLISINQFINIANKLTLQFLFAYLSATGLVLLIFLQHRTGVERERRTELEAANVALRESEASLERRVAERTRDLEVAADVSRQITTILDQHDLL